MFSQEKEKTKQNQGEGNGRVGIDKLDNSIEGNI